MPERSDEPVVSIVIAAYNAVGDLERAVRSAQAQTLSDFEILIVDDASTDETVALANRLASDDPRIVILPQNVNGGPAVARNRALERAQGRWVAVLDADDGYEPERLEVLVREAERLGADLIADNLLMFAAGEDRPVGLGYEETYLDGISPLTVEAYLAGETTTDEGTRSLGYLKPLVRRAFLEDNGLRYPEDIRCAEDSCLYASSLLKGAVFHVVPQAYYQYTVHRASTTQSRARMVSNIEHILRSNAHIMALAESLGQAKAVALLQDRHARLTKRLRRNKAKKVILDQPLLRGLIYAVKGRSRSPLEDVVPLPSRRNQP